MEEVEAVAGEEAAGGRKRKRGGEVGAGAEVEEKEEDEQEFGAYEKRSLLLLNEEDDEEEGVAEEAVAEVMRWLEAEISDDVAAGFVTINGNEESCGPSFSCAASTVMASVDTRAGAPPPPPVPWPVPDAAAKQETAAPDAEMDDEAWLAELLACGPALQGV